jgi:hypothetical protein
MKVSIVNITIFTGAVKKLEFVLFFYDSLLF